MEDRRVRRVHPADNVVTALTDLPKDAVVHIDEQSVVTLSAIPFGHKMAIAPIPRGARVVKYGEAIGLATVDIAPGELVHSHNLVTQRGIQRRAKHA